MEKARRAEIEILYEGKNITTPINEYMQDFQYTDIASGECDRIKISLQDVDRQWMGAWMPEKGDRMSGSLILKEWDADGDTQRLYCGEFELDDMSFSGRPLNCELGAVSVPKNEPFNTQTRTKTWESITIRQIAQDIAERAGIDLYYEAEDITVEILEQNEQTDSKFLFSTCEDYGLAMKVYANRIIIFDEETYENRPPVRTIQETDMIKWSYNSTVTGTYTGANVRYTDPNDDKDYLIKIGGGTRLLEINENTDSIEDAERKGIAKLNNENKKAVTMNMTIKTDIRVVAGSCVEVQGISSKIDGKYYVDKAATSKRGSGGCQTALDVRRVVPRIKTVSVGAVEQAKEEKESAGAAYTVVAGDTLWRIAKQYYGSGLQYETIYNANKALIEDTAKGRGKKDSSNGHWIFPGTVLEIPKEEAGQ